jgi:hypothetical protein
MRLRSGQDDATLSGTFGTASERERRNADLFFDDLMGRSRSRGAGEAIDAEDPSTAPNPYQPFIDKGTSPRDAGGEKFWLLNNGYWMELFLTMRPGERNLGNLSVPEVGAWLDANVRPVFNALGAVPEGKNSCGLVTYRGNTLLTRNVWHDKTVRNGVRLTGQFNALEGYLIPADLAARVDQRARARGYEVRVFSSRVNTATDVHAQPDLSSPVLGQLAAGSDAGVVGETLDHGLWVVKWGSGVGYVSKRGMFDPDLGI